MKMNSIRRAQTEDIQELAILFDKYRVFYSKESNIEVANSFLKERLKKQESVIFVHEDNSGEITGFVQLYPLFSSTQMQRLWLLNDLYVAPEFRGQGISIKLIDRSKILCKETNACGLMLETEKSNKIGNKLYPRTGFQRDDEHHFYHWDVG